MFKPVQSLILSLLLVSSMVMSGCTDSPKDSASTTTSTIKKTIAVIGHGDFLPDQIDTGQGTIGLPDDLAARIMEHLNTSQRFTVVERTALRKVVMEQRFGKVRESYMDRTLETAIAGMDDVSPFTLAVTGALAEDNDTLKDFQDLGASVGADYLVLGTIEKIEASQSSRALPYSKADFDIVKNMLDARLRLRVIDASTGSFVGATKFRAKFSEDVFSGVTSNTDAYTLYDNVGRIAAARVLDLTFPAHIAATEPLLLTRGSNDGTQVGDIYSIVREGDEVRDKSGVSIGKVRTTVAKARVVSTQPTLSVVEKVGNGTIAKGDIALLAEDTTADTGKPVRSGAQIGSSKSKGQATIAVGKLSLNRAFANGDLGPAHVEKMTNDLIVQLGNTRRFDVLERGEIDQLLDEKVFEALIHGGEIMDRMKKLDGADYIIHGEIDNFRIKTMHENIAVLNETQTRHTAVATGTVRIVDVHTGKVIAADKLHIDAEQKDIKDSNVPPLEHLMDAFTTSMTAKVVERLYPIKVLGSAGDGLVYINRGVDGGIRVGDTFELMQSGKELIDPDTGLSFGTADVKAGEVEIASVENSRSIARLVTGSTAQPGSILRHKQQMVKKPKVVESVNQPSW